MIVGSPVSSEPRADDLTAVIGILDRLDALLDAAGTRAVRSRSDHADGDYPELGVLDVLEVETVVAALAVAPEIDPSYEQTYRGLHRDGSPGRPTLGLALDLLCTTRLDRLRLLPLVGPGGALYDGGLVELAPAPAGTPLPRRVLLPGPLARRRLLGLDVLDSRILAAAKLIRSKSTLSHLPIGNELLVALEVQSGRLRHGGGCQVVGADGRLVETLVAAMAAVVDRPVLRVDVDRLIDDDLAEVVRREADATDAVLHLQTERPLREAWRWVADRAGAVVVSGPSLDAGLVQAGWPAVEIGLPPIAVRRRCWSEAAASIGVDLTDEQAGQLGSTYRLHVSDIADAVRTAAARRAGAVVPVPDVSDLAVAAGELAARGMAGVARRVEVSHGWDDLVIDADAHSQLQELCARVRHQEHVLDDWRMSRSTTAGRGTHALFSGPSGTGKTAAAQVLAGALGFQLWRVDLAGVVSKYIGETEKNLDAIFEAATGCDVVVLFDEADALFGKRSEVRDAHDRYANIEISYLLQRIEEHDGVTILATNLRQNLDDAFVRRLAFDVRFPFPDEQRRLAIWERVFPASVPLSPDVDVSDLARRYVLSGGQIRNVALAAAYLAAADGEPVSSQHLHHAARREFQKLGRDILLAGPGSGALA